MSKMRSAVLIVALVAMLGAAFCFHAAPARAASMAAPVSIGQDSPAVLDMRHEHRVGLPR